MQALSSISRFDGMLDCLATVGLCVFGVWLWMYAFLILGGIDYEKSIKNIRSFYNVTFNIDNANGGYGRFG